MISDARLAQGHRSLVGRSALATVCLSAFSSSWNAVGAGGTNVVDYLLIVSLVLTVSAWFTGVLPVFVSGWMIAPLVAAIVVGGFDVLVTGDSAVWVTMVTRIFLSTSVVCVLLTSISVFGSRTLLRVLRWWTAGIVVSAAAAGGESLGMVSIGPLLGQPTGARLSGLTSHPNSLAFSLTLALPVVFYFLGSASSFWGKLTWMLSGGVLVWALALTGSRAGLLVGIPIIVISFVSLLWSSRARLLVIPILIIGGILLAWWLPQALESTRLIQGALDSDSGRVSYNSDAWRVFADNPVLGGGFANMRGVSVPLMVLSAGGIVLFVAYYAFAFRSLPVLWRARSTLLARTGAFTLIAFIGFGALNPVWMERATYWPTLIAALCVLISQQSAGARGNPWVGATHSRWLSARPQSGSRSVGSLRGASAQSETPVL